MGLIIANGLVALAGSIFAQSQSYSDRYGSEWQLRDLLQ